MKLPSGILALIILVPALSGVVQAEIYRWVDENGVVTHSDVPPPGLPAGKADVQPAAQPGHPATDDLSPDMNVEISGVVQDTHGKPLRGVTMTILERRSIPGRLESREVRKKHKVNGAFTISCRN